MHSALDASIYRFSNDGSHFNVEIMDPQNFDPIGYFVVTLKIISGPSFHLCSPALVVACSFCRGMVECFLLGFCHDII